MLEKNDIERLPHHPGIYIFRAGNHYLYLGKSVNIAARVKSHLENAKLSPKEAAMIKNANAVEAIVTDCELKALLLEARLIKDHHPKYNVRLRDDKSFLYIKITIKDEYPKIFLSRKEDDGQSLYFGPFSSVKTTLTILREIRKIVPFCMQKNLKNRSCFYSKIGLCHPCPSFIIREKNGRKRGSLRKIYRGNIIRVIRLLRGKIQLIINDLSSQLKKKIKEEKFEEGLVLRNKIFRLQQLETRRFFDLNILTDYNQSEEARESLFRLLFAYFPILPKLQRIECYDISNLGADEATASMVVFTKGLIDKSQYRRFKIIGERPRAKSDWQRLDEVFQRRFKKKRSVWPIPDLIVVDGGTPQVRQLAAVLKKLKINIPLIGLAKNPDRLVLGLKNFPTLRPSSNNLGFQLLRLLRDESHRFARKYHLFLREKIF
jgi:excinuclease ABC subunit C